MPTILPQLIPNPSTFSVRQMRRRLSSRAGLFLFNSQPDSGLSPRRFIYLWSNALGSVVDAVRRHFNDHGHATFTLILPRSAESVRVRWSSPPSISWQSSVAAASVSAEFDEALAHE